MPKQKSKSNSSADQNDINETANELKYGLWNSMVLRGTETKDIYNSL